MPGLFTASILVLFAPTYWSAADYAAKDEADEVDVEFTAIQEAAQFAGDVRLPQIIANHLQQRSAEHAEDQVSARRGDARRASAHLPLGQRRLSTHRPRPAIPSADERRIAHAFSVNVVVTLLLAVLGGVIISNRALGGVDALSRTTQAIIAGDLSRGVPSRGTDDEFDRLAISVNAMLDRIEELMRGMRQVSNNIAHDLRTPLTRLRQRLERARERA